MADRIVVQVPAWLARSHGLDSRELEGTVAATTDKAILLQGTVSVRRADHCLRCGRSITNPTSQLVGYGPWCCEELGIDRNIDPEHIDDYRTALQDAHTFQLWLPKSQITAYNLNGDPDDIPQADPEPTKTSTATVQRGRIILDTHYEFRDRAKQVPGYRWNGNKKVWTYRATPATALALLEAYDGLPLETDQHIDQLVDDAAAIRANQHLKDDQDLPAIPGSEDGGWLHQRQAFYFARDLPAAMLAMDMGTGKSRVAVELMRHNDSRNVLIVCPNNVQGVWPREINRWDDRDVEVVVFRRDVEDHNLGSGSIAKRTGKAAEAQRLAHAHDRPFVVVINYEACWRDGFKKWAEAQRWDYIIADESHRIKGASTKASRWLAKVGQNADRRLALTGTPMPNSPLDLYGQYRFLDAGIFGTNFTRFRARYAIMGGYGGYQVIDYQRQEELAEKFHSIAYEVSADVLDLPPEHDIVRQVTIGGKARKLYRELTRQMAADLGDHEFTAANVLTRILRQQQITGGSINDDDGTNVEIDDAKEKELRELLEDLPDTEPVIVFCRFIHDLNVVRRVTESLDRRYGELSGRERTALTSQATMADDIDIAGVQIQAGGVGIDLSRARYCVFYSLGHSLGDYTQARKRVHRPGQERTTFYYHLVATATVDVDVYAALDAKEEVVDYVRRKLKPTTVTETP